MKPLLISLIALMFFSAGTHQDKGKWIIDSSSKLSIHGATNVNTFKCSMNSYKNNDTLEYLINDSYDMMFSRNQMTVPVRSFGCGNEMMTKDFWQTLKAERYPHIRIQFISLSNMGLRTLSKASPVTGKVEITLAGVTQKYTLSYTVERNSFNRVVLNGKQTICFSDFQLKAPQKMLGLIQVEEDLEVEFNLQLRAI